MRRSSAALVLTVCASSLAGCGSQGAAVGKDAGRPDARPTDAASPDASATTCTLSPPALSTWRLAAQGTSLVDALGRTVFLRGVDAGGRSKFAPYVPFDFASGAYASALDAYMARAASWGIDAMRVPFTWAALEPTEGQDDQAWLSRYAELLGAAWAHGIYTI